MDGHMQSVGTAKADTKEILASKESWDWDTKEKLIADISTLQEQFAEVHESAISGDGERVAVPVKTKDGQFTVCVNGEPWEQSFEKVWYLKFGPDGRLTALVRADDEWTVAVEGECWQEKFEYAWNTTFSQDGRAIAAQAKRVMDYLIVVDGTVWSSTFVSSRGLALSPGGEKAAAVVQPVPLKEADIFGFLEGTWTVAVNDKPWDRNFINVYSPTFSPDGRHVAAEVRLGICEYTIAKDGRPWDQTFGCVWEPCFRPQSNSIVAPVRTGEGWTLAEDGRLIWNGRYDQLWRPKISPDGNRIAAVAAPIFGKWTIAVDDTPWKKTYGDCVLEPFFSDDSRHVAAIVKENNRWTIAVDGVPWTETFDMIWDPVFDPAGEYVVAKAEWNGRFCVVVNGRIWKRTFDAMWEPTFSPDGKKLLVRSVEDEKYYRHIIDLQDILDNLR